MAKKILGALAGAVLALTGAAQAALAQEAPRDPDAIRIGAILAMSGPASWYGNVMSRGIRQAVEEINAAGGVDGIPIEVFIDDHQSGVAREGVAAMNRLINLHNVQAVLTSFSPPTLAIAPIADERGILLLNGGGVSTALVGASRYLFHNRSLASDLGRAASAHAHERGLSRMAQLAWRNDAGDSVIQAVEPFWRDLGGEIVATESMDVGAPNIDTQMAKIRASRPDWVALWTFSPDTGLGARRAREFGLDVPIIGIEFTSDIAEIGGVHLEGYEYTTDYFTASEGWSQRFADGYRERFGEDPEFYGANYYENIYVVAEAARRARAKGGDWYSGRNLAAAIRENPEFPSVYGATMIYQENGVASKPVALFRIENGEPVFVNYVTTY